MAEFPSFVYLYPPFFDQEGAANYFRNLPKKDEKKNFVRYLLDIVNELAQQTCEVEDNQIQGLTTLIKSITHFVNNDLMDKLYPIPNHLQNGF